jgi:hypothetical protein
MIGTRTDVWRMSSQRSPGQPFFEPFTDAGNWPASGRQSSHVPALT